MNLDLNNSQRAFCLIKFFSQENHYISFMNGCSILRTPHYYRICEDAGRGDRTESCLGYWDSALGHEMPSLTRDGNPVDMTDIKSILVYPASEQHDAWLQSWCMIGPDNEFELSLQRMIEEFGSYFVMLPAENIGNYANLLAKASNLEVRYGLVQYSENPLHRSLTTKDRKFAYQKEFRFYLGSCPKDEIQDKTIHLDQSEKILSDAGALKLVSPEGKKYYFGLGSKVVITCASSDST